MSAKLTPKGMRDIAPEDMFIREEVMEKIRSAFRSYGYRPLETPALEYIDTLRAKAGQEVEKQIFVIDGGEYGLRFDLTVPLARYAASSDAPKPFKRYAIDAVWRKEEPQRGRFREFYQADADIIGSPSMRCEAELLRMAMDLCMAFGFQKPKILLNNRKILDGVAAKLGVEVAARDEVYRVLDKLDKIGQAEVAKLLREILGDKADELIKLMKTKASNKEKLALATQYSPEGAGELEELLGMCDFPVEIDLFLARGLGYYTGPVYEIVLSEGIGTVMAGGRYDNLLGVYGQPAPAVGISVGIERLVTLITERNRQDAKAVKKTDSVVFVAPVKRESYAYALQVAAQLRAAGIACETDLNERHIRKQFDYANALGIRFAAVIGTREETGKMMTLHDMQSGKEDMLPLQAAIERIKGR
jgi:histidyl-tRNA synthetase